MKMYSPKFIYLEAKAGLNNSEFRRKNSYWKFQNIQTMSLYVVILRAHCQLWVCSASQWLFPKPDAPWRLFCPSVSLSSVGALEAFPFITRAIICPTRLSWALPVPRLEFNSRSQNPVNVWGSSSVACPHLVWFSAPQIPAARALKPSLCHPDPASPSWDPCPARWSGKRLYRQKARTALSGLTWSCCAVSENSPRYFCPAFSCLQQEGKSSTSYSLVAGSGNVMHIILAFSSHSLIECQNAPHVSLSFFLLSRLFLIVWSLISKYTLVKP